MDYVEFVHNHKIYTKRLVTYQTSRRMYTLGTSFMKYNILPLHSLENNEVTGHKANERAQNKDKKSRIFVAQSRKNPLTSFKESINCTQ